MVEQRFLVKDAATGHHPLLDMQWNSHTRVLEGYTNKDDWGAGCAGSHGERGSAPRVMVDSPAADR
jgi:hypothetical protein